MHFGVKTKGIPIEIITAQLEQDKEYNSLEAFIGQNALRSS